MFNKMAKVQLGLGASGHRRRGVLRQTYLQATHYRPGVMAGVKTGVRNSVGQLPAC
ncbi:hypothetical protein EMEDMD4_910005 [Sinorhizobium medicae]|uniref:Uncharacterized protein n=1 Tax=Sinorhizobium medicae TaxID=110321 RepID=A0A508X7P5_9HYPH|nr:hypothetical protein EMEDMD4_910005 [Sinorhizobium medicae]